MATRGRLAHLPRRLLSRLAHHYLVPSPVPALPPPGTPPRPPSLSPVRAANTTRLALALAACVRLKLCVRMLLWREEAGRGREGEGWRVEGPVWQARREVMQGGGVGRDAPRQAVDATDQPCHLPALLPLHHARIHLGLV
jgi:hypothetical protein